MGSIDLIFFNNKKNSTITRQKNDGARGKLYHVLPRNRLIPESQRKANRIKSMSNNATRII